MESNDIIEVFALKKPVWSFKFGPLLKYFVNMSKDKIKLKFIRNFFS